MLFWIGGRLREVDAHEGLTGLMYKAAESVE